MVLWSLLVLQSIQSGCSGYRVQGKVVAGAQSNILIVDRVDPRLDQSGLAGATVQLTLDPGRLNRKALGGAVSDDEGRFALAVNEPGAGILVYEVRAIAQLRSHQTAIHLFALPAKNKRLLITLNRGPDSYRPEPKHILDETLEMGRPYMQGR